MAPETARVYRFSKAGSRHDWQTLIRSAMTKSIGRDRGAPETRAERVEREREIAKDLYTKFPKPHDKRQRDAEWTRLTGKDTDSLYRRKKELGV